MNKRIEFLKEETISGRNKCKRMALPKEFTVANMPCSIAERKAYALKMTLDNMPIFIGEKELIVGTRTYFKPNVGNEDSHDIFEYTVFSGVPYINQEDIERFGVDESYMSSTHYTPDMGILLEHGVGGILENVDERLKDDSLNQSQIDFLNSVKIVHKAFSNLLIRYAEYAKELAEKSTDITSKNELLLIADNCSYLSYNKPKNFLQATQLLWLGHLVMIIESQQFNTYGRLDVILQKYVQNETDEELLEILQCLLLKMYDQTDIIQSYTNKYASQLVVTLGGVDENGENAVSKISLLFLDAIDSIRLPDPEFNLRINSKNPKEFLEKAAKLTISGCNFIAYYNDDIYIENLINIGIDPKLARIYGFDLCQDINIPGHSDWFKSGATEMIDVLLNVLETSCDYENYEDLHIAYKDAFSENIKKQLETFNSAHKSMLEYRDGNKDEFFAKIKNGKPYKNMLRRSLMSPYPFLSSLFHGCIETAFDIVEEGFIDKNKGVILVTPTETINSLAAIKKVVFDDKLFTLEQVKTACDNNFDGDEVMRRLLWSAPKWGNDDDYVDDIAKDILEYGLKEIVKYKTVSGGTHLAGIHQAHPVLRGGYLQATPEGRKSGTPVAVTLTPESGTMKNGPTAVLRSGVKIDSSLVHWNFCIMINYFRSTFTGNNGEKIFLNLLKGYFDEGGLQHQPNVLDVTELKKAQLNPSQYKDLIVRLWGVSAHFVDLPLNLQNEMIERFS